MKFNRLLPLLLVLASACAKPVSDEPVRFQHNIVWLVAEDLSPYIPAYGDSTIVTPALDRLAREGVVYDNFFSPHPVCAPARAAIITGMYANHIGASHMRTGPWYSDEVPDEVIARSKQFWPREIEPYEAVPPEEVRMFTEYLRSAGYYCTNNAKQDYQFRKTPVAWDESSGQAHWRNRKPGQPFFAVFNFNITHESQIWQKADDSLWVDDDLVVPVPPYLPDTEIGRTDIRRMYSNILEMDHQVGEVLSQLEEDGLLDSTIIVWYTDHGGPLPRQKRLLFDSGIRVPMIIRFPGEAGAGLRDGRMLSFIDLAPTTLSLAGIEPPDYMEGRAFLGEYMDGYDREYVFGAADRFDEKEDRVRSVRDERFKYIRYYKPELPMFLEVAYRNQMPIMQELLRLRDADSLTDEQALWFRETKPDEELFDLLNDPYEVHDLSGEPAYSEKLTELRNALDQWMDTGKDTGIGDELQLRDSLWPGGIQPVTAEPVIRIEENTVNITSETPGASIGYVILLEPGDSMKALNTGSWKLYTSPFQITGDQRVMAISHRLGYRRSAMVVKSN